MKFYLKEKLRSILRLSPLYKKERKRELAKFNEISLELAVKSAICNVPYYAKYKPLLKNGFNITDLPLLRKNDIMGHEKEFISRKVIKCLLSKKETGGSTGMSLELFESISTVIKKNVMSDYAFSLIGENLRIAELRGNKPQNGAIVDKIGDNKILLSSYQLGENTIDLYLDALRDYKIECLHVYPSSLSIFTRLVRKKYGITNLPDLKGILSSSEIFSSEEKKLVRETFPNIKLVDFYVHNELACCAIAVDDGFYEFNNNYGYVEFYDIGQSINNNHRIAEIVATSIMNKTMPFIRYATEDYVELDEKGNVVSIVGRTSDFVINQDKQMVPCIVCTRHCSMQNVISFQYYQEKEGEVIFKVKVNHDFCQTDIKYLQEDLANSFAKMCCKIEVVNEMTKTKIGKQPRLIQKLDIKKYN